MLEYDGLSKSVDHWRRTGMEFPDEALVGCRKVVEISLRTLASPLPNPRIPIRELIDYSEDEGVIDHPIALKCHEIRKRGNRGAHESVEVIDARMTLELLDDFLRWMAEQNGLIPFHEEGERPTDPIFFVRSDDEVAALSRRARLAASLSGSKEVEKKAQEAKTAIAACDDENESALEKMADLIRQAEEIGASAKVRQDEAQRDCERLFDLCGQNLELLKSQRKSVTEGVEAVETEIREILNEHDFVQKLLQGDNYATEKQLDVMAFPRGSNTVTNTLQIAGGAGTGKTLCLLAKIIKEVKQRDQMSLFDQPKKKALFICFNKGLANYVRNILAGYPEAVSGIEVAHYDEYFNQLVRDKPKPGFEHLTQYARDARYPAGYSIVYGVDGNYVELLKQAQETVSKRHPENKGDYYLDSSNEDELAWVREEIAWIDARFATDDDARELYPKAERVGRGKKHLPSERIRRIILEIRDELNSLLESRKLYTIEQATRRLYAEKNLPAYDAIAIDEVQDFSLLSVMLLMRLRRNANSRVYLAGDENQKIYRRDFSWKELGEGVKGTTIKLEENMRNSRAIQRFSERLLGIACPKEQASHCVYVTDADDARTVDLLRRLSRGATGETTALISGRQNWARILRDAGLGYSSKKAGNISGPGLYLIGDYQGKGLEFDNVVVDYTRVSSEDEEEEQRLRYVHFTRARKRLYIRYQGEPPKLLREFYPDYIT